MSNLHPNCCLKFDFQKVDQHAGGKWLIHDTKRRRTISCKAWNSPAEYPSWVVRCDIKGSVCTVLNPIFSKKVQGQKHPGRWGIVEHQISSIKMLFKTNTKSNKHPSIRFLSKSKTQLVNQKKQKVTFSPGTAHSAIERDGVQLRQYWMTLLLYIRPITELVYGMYIHIYTYISTQSFWTGTKVIRRKHIIQPTGFGACSSTCCQWDGEDVPAPWERSNSHTPVRVQKSCVNPFIWYNICSRGVFISNSKLRNFVIVAIECFFATINRCSVVTGINRWSMMIYSSL